MNLFGSGPAVDSVEGHILKHGS